MTRTRRVSRRLAIGLVVTVILLCLVPWFLPTKDAVPAQTVVLILAGAVYVWYTWETTKLRQVAEEQLGASQTQVGVSLRQANAQVRPVVIAYQPHGPIAIKNVGPGLALNVQVRPVPVHVDRGLPYEVRFGPTIVAIMPGEEARVEPSLHAGEKVIPNSGYTFVTPRSMEDKERAIIIDYEGVEKTRYTSTVGVNRHGYKLLSLEQQDSVS